MAQNKKKYGIARKITKTGDYTYYVTIPREYIEALGWRCKQKVAVKLSGKKVVIEDWKE
jgi:bifunctional DNA-binding transcriptional regulator/antitoxin component of YhaV-PrlF toxin-antitoxin module